MIQCTAIGCVVSCCQILQVGIFAAPDYSGVSVCGAISATQQLALLRDARVFTTDDRSLTLRINPTSSWDVNKQVQDAVDGLQVDEWGLDYENFKREPVIDQIRQDLKEQEIVLESIASASKVPEKST